MSRRRDLNPPPRQLGTSFRKGGIKKNIMHWKNWPYWVKGGIVALALGAIFFGVLFYLVQETCYSGSFETSCVFNNPWVYHHPQSFAALQFSIFLLIIGGILAIAFGLFGKFKNRKTKAIPLS